MPHTSCLSLRRRIKNLAIYRKTNDMMLNHSLAYRTIFMHKLYVTDMTFIYDSYCGRMPGLAFYSSLVPMSLTLPIGHLFIRSASLFTRPRV